MGIEEYAEPHKRVWVKHKFKGESEGNWGYQKEVKL